MLDNVHRDGLSSQSKAVLLKSPPLRITWETSSSSLITQNYEGKHNNLPSSTNLLTVSYTSHLLFCNSSSPHMKTMRWVISVAKVGKVRVAADMRVVELQPS